MKKINFGYYGNFNTTHQTEVYIADALERAGHIVHRIDRNNTNLIDCDYVFFAKLFNMILINKARKKGITTISWTFDLYRGKYRKRHDYHLPHYKADIVITTDADDEYHTVRQGVHKPEKIEIKGKKIYNVIFVGNPGTGFNHYKLRREMIQRVKPKIFQGVRGLALNKLLGQSKIALGDSIPASNYWSNRIYEMTGRGGFYIHPKVEGMPDYIPQFEQGKAKEMVKYYLEHEEEREELRRIQFEMCPTYDDRIKEFIKIIKENT